MGFSISSASLGRLSARSRKLSDRQLRQDGKSGGIWKAIKQHTLSRPSRGSRTTKVEPKATKGIQLIVTAAASESPLRPKYAQENLACDPFAPLGSHLATTTLQACPEDEQLSTAAQLLATQDRLAEATQQLSRLGGRDYDRCCEVETLKTVTRSRLSAAEADNKRLSAIVDDLEARHSSQQAELAAAAEETSHLATVVQEQSSQLVALSEHAQAASDWGFQLQQHTTELSTALYVAQQHVAIQDEVSTKQAAELAVLQEENRRFYTATLQYMTDCEAAKRHQLAQLQSMRTERDKLTSMLITATDQHVLADHSKQNVAAADEWALQMRDVFHDALKEQQRQLGTHSWEFLDMLGLDLQNALTAANSMAQSPLHCSNLPQQQAHVAAEIHRAIRKQIFQVHDDRAHTLKRKGAAPSQLLFNRAVTLILTAYPAEGFVPGFPPA